MKVIEANGVRLALRDEGRGDPPFLFIHGWACDSSVWEPQFESLRREYRCVAIDLRGRGETPPAFPCDAGTAAADVAAVCRALGLAPAVVVGHDLGGLVALVLNEAHPDLVAGVVVGDAPIGNPPLPVEERGRLAREIRAAGSLAPARSLLDSFLPPGTPPAVADRVRKLILSCPPEVAAGMLENGDLQERLDSLLREADRKPFMAFWPDHPLGDPVRLREITVFLRQEPIAGAGHFFQLERPDITNALLRAFIDDVHRDPRIAATQSST